MPELAEVDYYRKQWNPGLGKRVEEVLVHARTRIFRKTDVRGLTRALTGAVLERSMSSGKQMMFRFSGSAWIGVHLGMTGHLEVQPAGFVPLKHDHFVLRQERSTLVFTDPRQFGRVRLDLGPVAPAWWREQAPAVVSSAFTLEAMAAFFARHPKMPVKGALLLQERFPGIGNWMADEVLWRARVKPTTLVGRLRKGETRAVWQMLRFVCRGASRTVGVHGGDPPRGWLFHQRWGKGGVCPRDTQPLTFETIGGRTTAWCRICQGTRGRRLAMGDWR